MAPGRPRALSCSLADLGLALVAIVLAIPLLVELVEVLLGVAR